MGKGKITSGMSTRKIVMTMCEGNPGAFNVIMQMMNDPCGYIYILLCDSLNIRGSKLYMLHNDCCGRNNEKFNRTLMMLGCGIFTEEQIQSNLELVRAIPFIDDSIVIDGVPPYGVDFGPTDEKWDDFCRKNEEAFTKKLDAILEQQKAHNKVKQKCNSKTKK